MQWGTPAKEAAPADASNSAAAMAAFEPYKHEVESTSNKALAVSALTKSAPALLEAWEGRTADFQEALKTALVKLEGDPKKALKAEIKKVLPLCAQTSSLCQAALALPPAPTFDVDVGGSSSDPFEAAEKAGPAPAAKAQNQPSPGKLRGKKRQAPAEQAQTTPKQSPKKKRRSEAGEKAAVAATEAQPWSVEDVKAYLGELKALAAEPEKRRQKAYKRVAAMYDEAHAAASEKMKIRIHKAWTNFETSEA